MSFTAEGLTNGTAYTFTVKTIDKALNKSTGVSTAEAVKPIDTSDKTPPADVTNLNAVSTGNSKISVSWTNPVDADLHQVEITVQKEGETGVSTMYISAEKGKDSGYVIEGLAANTTYTVTVKTIDKALNKSKDGVSKTVTTKTAGSVMTIILTQNPEKTVWTKDSVTITAASSTSIKKAKWKEGSGHSAKDVLESGNLLVGNSFTVTQNGIYSVVVQDNDGRREVETITIANIDKTPPPAPKNFTAQYTLSAKKIVLNWTDPVDTASGLKELKLSYTVNGANEKTETIAKGVQTFEIENVEPQSSPVPYAFSLKAVDNVGNEGAATSRTITPSPQAEVTGISLNRTHLDTKMTDRNIKVTITGSNFDKLTSLLVQVTDGSTSQPPVTATIDAPNNKATATVQAPKPSHPTDEGTTYTVKAIVNSTTPAAVTASFKVSNPATVSNIVLTPAQLKLGSATKVSVAVTGTNFDIRGETKIQLLDSKGDEVSGSMVTVPANEETATAFSAEIPLPTKIDFYTVAVYFDEVKENETSTLQLYGAPEITSVNIPKAGTGYAGNKLPVMIKGKNFTAPGASFSGSGASITNFTVVNDTTATAEVTCPYSAGEHTVTVMCGTESSKTGTISVKDYSTGYEVGKIVLANKALVDKAGYAIDSSNPPVGIICGFNSYKVPRMIALHTESYLEWAMDGSTGYNTKFEGIICTPSQTGSGAAETATFTGDTDGSDNWEYIKQQDPAGAADAATNYPAFYWVNQYNTQYAAQLGGTNFAWYMPSLAELCEVYKNRDAINESLAKIHGLDSGYADSTLDTSWYRSSSQDSYSNDYAWDVNFSDGNVYFNLKYNYDYSRVCCLAGF
ncbi:fibronectin type III domain-containing protein [Treponema vincentii]|nr:fibronectin type III domain-containing protein [Treponema vincentii]